HADAKLFQRVSRRCSLLECRIDAGRTADGKNPKRSGRRPKTPAARSTKRSVCERIRADLHLDELALCAQAALNMPNEVRAVIRVDRPSLPPERRVVDAPVHAALIEAERIRHTERVPLAGLRVQREQRI